MSDMETSMNKCMSTSCLIMSSTLCPAGWPNPKTGLAPGRALTASLVPNFMCQYEHVFVPPDNARVVWVNSFLCISLNQPVLSVTLFPPALFSLDFPVIGSLSPLSLSEAVQRKAPMESLVLHNKYPDACWTIGLLADSQRHWLLPAPQSVWCVSSIKSEQRDFF